MPLIEEPFYRLLFGLKSDPFDVKIVYTNTNLEHTLVYKYYDIQYNHRTSYNLYPRYNLYPPYHESYTTINHISTVYKVPYIFNNDTRILLHITCSGNNCLCEELVKIFNRYEHIQLVLEYYINCYNKYKPLHNLSILTIINVEILNDYIKLRNKDIRIISCSFDPNFLVTTGRIGYLEINSCDTKFLLWCYVNLRYKKMPLLKAISWNSNKFTKNVKNDASTLYKQIAIYMGNK